MNARPAHGFTLIELMVSITVLGILTMLALPSYGRWIANMQVRNMAESIQNGLRSAQREAVARNGSASFLLTNDSPPTCTSTQANDGANWAVCSGSTLVQQNSGKSGSASAIVSSPEFTAVTFDGLGRPTLNSAATISITSANGSCQQASSDGVRCLNVLMSSGGKVRLCDPRLPAGNPSACS